MIKADLIALAERVERAEGPSFTFELEIFRAINPQATRHSIPNNYTASLDAAMTLVPHGFLWTMDSWEGSRWSAGIWRDRRWLVHTSEKRTSRTPALALTAASLRAIAEEMDA